MALKIPYGINTINNEVCSPDNASRFDKDGEKIKYICPCCKENLDLKKGDINVHHFAHKADSICTKNPKASFQTALHYKAKQIFENSEEKIIELPEVSPYFAESKFLYKTVIIEKKLGNIIPDVLLISESGEHLMVEIKVYNDIDDEKFEKIYDLGINCLEIDIEALNIEQDVIDEELLKKVIFTNYKASEINRKLIIPNLTYLKRNLKSIKACEKVLCNTDLSGCKNSCSKCIFDRKNKYIESIVQEQNRNEKKKYFFNYKDILFKSKEDIYQVFLVLQEQQYKNYIDKKRYNIKEKNIDLYLPVLETPSKVGNSNIYREKYIDEYLGKIDFSNEEYANTNIQRLQKILCTFTNVDKYESEDSAYLFEKCVRNKSIYLENDFSIQKEIDLLLPKYQVGTAYTFRFIKKSIKVKFEIRNKENDYRGKVLDKIENEILSGNYSDYCKKYNYEILKNYMDTHSYPDSDFWKKEMEKNSKLFIRNIPKELSDEYEEHFNVNKIIQKEKLSKENWNKIERFINDVNSKIGLSNIEPSIDLYKLCFEYDGDYMDYIYDKLFEYYRGSIISYFKHNYDIGPALKKEFEDNYLVCIKEFYEKFCKHDEYFSRIYNKSETNANFFINSVRIKKNILDTIDEIIYKDMYNNIKNDFSNYYRDEFKQYSDRYYLLKFDEMIYESMKDYYSENSISIEYEALCHLILDDSGLVFELKEYKKSIEEKLQTLINESILDFLKENKEIENSYLFKDVTDKICLILKETYNKYSSNFEIDIELTPFINYSLNKTNLMNDLPRYQKKLQRDIIEKSKIKVKKYFKEKFDYNFIMQCVYSDDSSKELKKIFNDIWNDLCIEDCNIDYLMKNDFLNISNSSVKKMYSDIEKSITYCKTELYNSISFVENVFNGEVCIKDIVLLMEKMFKNSFYCDECYEAFIKAEYYLKNQIYEEYEIFLQQNLGRDTLNIKYPDFADKIEINIICLKNFLLEYNNSLKYLNDEKIRNDFKYFIEKELNDILHEHDFDYPSSIKIIECMESYGLKYSINKKLQLTKEEIESIYLKCEKNPIDINHILIIPKNTNSNEKAYYTAIRKGEKEKPFGDFYFTQLTPNKTEISIYIPGAKPIDLIIGFYNLSLSEKINYYIIQNCINNLYNQYIDS